MPSFFATTITLLAAGLQFAAAVQVDVNNVDSIKAASRTLAFGLQSWYHNNVSGVPATAVGTLPAPLYWWEAGAVWGGMVDYFAYTNDTSYNAVTTQALMAQVGPNFNYMPPAYFTSLGNDDQAFWALAVLSAQEYGFPVPSGQKNTLWLDLAKAVFDSQTPRWETAHCNGGLRWQIFESNKGWDYKNTISNGGLFQIAARLARYTGNQTYVEWAGKTWDWMSGIGLISQDYQVFDGADDLKNCSSLDHTTWSYNPAMLIYGTAMLANFTNDKVWKDRTDGLLTSIEKSFFSPFKNGTQNIMYEPACEPLNTCNDDQFSFKAYLSRWLAKSAVVYPSITASVRKYLVASAQAACKSCTGGDNGQTCGQKWYVNGYDGKYGVGQELSAMETVQALLLLDEATKKVPRHQANVTIQVVPVTSEFPLTPPTSTPPSTTPSPTSPRASPDSSPRPSTTVSGNTNTADRASCAQGTSWTTISGLTLVAMAFGSGLEVLQWP